VEGGAGCTRMSVEDGWEVWLSSRRMKWCVVELVCSFVRELAWLQ